MPTPVPSSALALALAALTAALGCAASSPRVEEERPEEVRTVYRGSDGRAVAARSDREIVREVQVRATPARTWGAVRGAYLQLGLAVARQDSANGEIGTAVNRVRGRLGKTRISDYVDCGVGALGLPIADQYPVSLQVTTHLLLGDTNLQTTVRTLVRASAKPDAVSGDPVACLSKGELERRVGEYTTAALAPGGA